MELTRDKAARMCALAAEGVDPEVAGLQVMGDVNHPAVKVIEAIQKSEGVDMSRAILIGAGRALEEHVPTSPLDRIAHSVEVAGDLLSDVMHHVVAERTMTCALGVALRQVLPFAENEVLALHDSAHRNGDLELSEQAQDASRSITRAQAVLNKLEKTHLAVRHLEDDHFDEEFQIKFED